MKGLEKELKEILPDIKCTYGYSGDLNGKYGGEYLGQKDFDFNIDTNGNLSIYYLENFDKDTETKLRYILEKHSMIFSKSDKPLYR